MTQRRGSGKKAPVATARDATIRLVRCPQCGGDSVYAPTNPYRPFCSQRCKAIDLGAWADESFRLPDSDDPQDPPGDDPARLQ